MHKQSSLLALDVGQRRVGVAIADTIARLARPLTTLDYSSEVTDAVIALANKHQAQAIVVGLPRGLSGQHTQQTIFTEEFVKVLKQKTAIPVHMQDEAVTSAQAEQELQQRGKSYTKKDIDALAATYILEDFLRDKL